MKTVAEYYANLKLAYGRALSGEIGEEENHIAVSRHKLHKKLMQLLPENEAKVIDMFHLEGKDLNYIAMSLGYSRSHVGHLNSQGCRKLNHILNTHLTECEKEAEVKEKFGVEKVTAENELSKMIKDLA